MAGKTIVYILGAGASAADGAPVTQKLILNAIINFWSQPSTGTNLSEFCPVLKEIDKMFGTNLEDVIEKVSSTNRLTGKWTDAYYKVDVEEFLTEIENKAKKNCEGYKELRKKAHYFIFHPLCYKTNLIHQSALKHYSAFVENVLKVGVRHHIVTFNYDTLLERAICEKCFTLPKERRLLWTYVVNFTSDISHNPYYISDESIAEIFLLKLHGSFNWGWYPKTKEITMYPLADILQYEKFYCGQNTWYPGQDNQEPLLIPPTREKDLNIPALKRVWEEAGSSLREATELHVIGYSAPEADKGARELILQELKPRINELERVVLANKSANPRIKDLLSTMNCKEYNTFKEYLECEFRAELKW